MKNKKQSEKVLINTQEYDRLKNIETIWEQLPRQVKSFATHLGTPIRVIRRDLNYAEGILRAVEFEPKELELICEVTEKSYIERKIIREVKVVKVPVNALVQIEFIYEREERPYKEEEIPV